MGTRCITTVYDNDGEPIACMYRQFDGYPEGHGAELARFVKPRLIINGFSDQKPGEAANGMGCLAAQMIAHFKGPHPLGGFYVYAPSTTMEDCGAEYHYHVRFVALGQPAAVEVKS